MYYLRIEDGGFGFINDAVHEIEESDIPVTEEDYNKYFELNSQGKQFRLKEIAIGTGLFDYIEEYTPTPSVPEQSYQEVNLKLQELVLMQQMTILELQNKKEGL